MFVRLDLLFFFRVVNGFSVFNKSRKLSITRYSYFKSGEIIFPVYGVCVYFIAVSVV